MSELVSCNGNIYTERRQLLLIPLYSSCRLEELYVGAAAGNMVKYVEGLRQRGGV